MSKLPTIQERPIPQAAPYNPQQVVVADTSAMPKALSQLGQSLGQVGETAIRIDEQRNRFEYSLAKSKFLQTATEIQANVESDPDFEKMPQRYKEEMLKAKQNILASSKLNDDYKSLLTNEMAIYEQKNYGNILNNYEKRQYDYKIAETGRAVEGNFEAASRMGSEQDKEIALANSKNLFMNAISLNDPQREEKIGKMEVELEQRMAKLDLMQKNPYQQIQMIDAENKKPNSNLTKYLTPEQRIEYRQRAEIQAKQLEKEGESNLKKTEKDKERKIEDILADNLSKGVSFSDLPINIKLRATKLDEDRYTKLYNEVNGVSEINPEQQEKNFQMYEDLYTNNPNEFADISRAEIIARVPQDKRQIVSKWQEKARLNLQPDVMLKQRNSIKTSTLRSIGIKESSDQGIKFKTAFDNEVQSFIEENKKEPNSKEAQEIANSLIVKATFDKGIFGLEKEKFIFEGEPKDVVVPKDIIVNIQTGARNSGKKIPSEEEIKLFYVNKLMRK